MNIIFYAQRHQRENFLDNIKYFIYYIKLYLQIECRFFLPMSLIAQNIKQFNNKALIEKAEIIFQGGNVAFSNISRIISLLDTIILANFSKRVTSAQMSSRLKCSLSIDIARNCRIESEQILSIPSKSFFKFNFTFCQRYHRVFYKSVT